MSEEEIREILLDVLGEIASDADLESLQGDEELAEALGLDATDMVNLSIALKDELGVEIPESDFIELDTLDNIVAYLLAQQ